MPYSFTTTFGNAVLAPCLATLCAEIAASPKYSAVTNRGEIGDTSHQAQGTSSDHSVCCPPRGNSQHPPAVDRFRSHHVIAESGCWNWVGGKKAAGYGQFAVGGRKVIAHRWAYMHYRGRIPDGYEVDHLCRNPSCVNPGHLEAVTLQVNRERRNAAKTHCNHGHEYTPQNTRWGTDGDGYRVRFCKSCDSIRNKRYNLRRSQRALHLHDDIR